MNNYSVRKKAIYDSQEKFRQVGTSSRKLCLKSFVSGTLFQIVCFEVLQMKIDQENLFIVFRYQKPLLIKYGCKRKC